MLRFMVKVGAYGLFGYAVYEFVRGAMGAEANAATNGIGQQARQWGGELREKSQGVVHQARQTLAQCGDELAGHAAAALNGGNQRDGNNMTGPGEGQTVHTQENSGESVPHKVGRGVVS